MNDNNMEEVPLDLFSQVSLDEFEEKEEVVETTPVTPAAPSGNFISIPADAYTAVLNQEKKQQQAAEAAPVSQPAPVNTNQGVNINQ